MASHCRDRSHIQAGRSDAALGFFTVCQDLLQISLSACSKVFCSDEVFEQ